MAVESILLVDDAVEADVEGLAVVFDEDVAVERAGLEDDDGRAQVGVVNEANATGFLMRSSRQRLVLGLLSVVGCTSTKPMDRAPPPIDARAREDVGTRPQERDVVSARRRRRRRPVRR